MSRSFIGATTSGSVPAHSCAASRRYSLCTASTSGELSISNSVAFFRRLLRMMSSAGKRAIVCRPTTLLNLSIRAVGDDATDAYVVVLRLRQDRAEDAVHRKDRIEVVGGDDQRAVRVLQGRSEAAADHVAQHVEDH